METTEILSNPDVRNVSCVEVLEACRELDIPLSRELSAVLALPETVSNLLSVQRYGSPFAQASGIILRNISLYGPSSREVHERVFGIDTTRAWDDVRGYVTAQHTELSDTEIEELVLLEMAEIAESPNSFYRLDLLNKTRSFTSEGAALLWRLMRSGVRKEDSRDLPQFSVNRDSKIIWGNCKDSEYYLAATLAWTSARTHNGARACVYVNSQNQPIFYQKVGEYAIHLSERFSNATAVTLSEIAVNGVIVPPGTLVGLESSLSSHDMQQPQDRVLSIGSVSSVFPLRLTVFSLNSIDAQVSFRHQYGDFTQNVRMTDVTLDSFKDTAKKIIGP